MSKEKLKDKVDKITELTTSFCAKKLNEYFGTKKSSVGNKAAEIRKMFKMNRLTNFDFIADSRKEDHLIYNTVLVDGFIVPISSIPEEYQQIVREARERGEDVQFWTK